MNVTLSETEQQYICVAVDYMIGIFQDAINDAKDQEEWEMNEERREKILKHISDLGKGEWALLEMREAVLENDIFEVLLVIQMLNEQPTVKVP